MLMLIVVLLFVSILYIVEVWLGSSSYVYNCEVGKASEMREKSRISKGEFFSKMLPLLLIVLGLPVLFLHQSLGLGLLLLAVLSHMGSYFWISSSNP